MTFWSTDADMQHCVQLGLLVMQASQLVTNWKSFCLRPHSSVWGLLRFPKTESFGASCNMNKFDQICQQLSSFLRNLYMSCTFFYSSWEWWSLGLPYSCIMGSKVWRQGRRQIEKWALNRRTTQRERNLWNFDGFHMFFRSLLDQPGEDAGGLVLDLLHSCHYFPCRIPAVFSRHSVLSWSGSGLHRKLSDGHCQTKGPGGQETF